MDTNESDRPRLADDESLDPTKSGVPKAAGQVEKMRYSVDMSMGHNDGAVTTGSHSPATYVREQHNESDYSSTKRTNYGGVVVGMFAIAVVLIVVLMVGKVVIGFITGSVDSGLSGNSTCRDYLASADDYSKVATMKQLYIKANMPKRAASPWILQNTEMQCSYRLDSTLAGMVAGQQDYQ